MWESREIIFELWKYDSNNINDAIKVKFTINEKQKRIEIIKACIWDHNKNEPIRQLTRNELKKGINLLKKDYDDYFLFIAI